jgi:hypothetical protein
LQGGVCTALHGSGQYCGKSRFGFQVLTGLNLFIFSILQGRSKNEEYRPCWLVQIPAFLANLSANLH